MRVTIFRTKPDGSGETIANEEFSKFIERIKSGTHVEFVKAFRNVFLELTKNEHWVNYDRIPRVCASSEYHRKGDGQRDFRHYNGISVLNINNLNNQLEIDKVKSWAALIPQTFCVLNGADGHSVSIWTLATLPDGTLPKDEKQAELFCAQAYATSILCYAPTCEFHITIEPPTLDKTILLTYDENPYINPHPTPFIIEKPTADSLNMLVSSEKNAKALDRLKPSAEAYITMTQMFNAAWRRAHEALPNWKMDSAPEQMLTRAAAECAVCGLPQEEVVSRMRFRFYKMDEIDIRTTVQSVYEDHEGLPTRHPMSKHQIVAYRLREFMKRRYEIRFNEILQMTEFRERESLQFLFRELSRRELNTIHHQALLEGIEPTFGEVDELVHSSYVPIYNPITHYLNTLPNWDGKDRLKALAAMVPNDNKNWEMLFTRWFLSMVAHWMNCDTTHSNQTAPILIGAQGYRKSTFCRLLLPPELQNFFTDSIDFRSNIEAERSLSRFLLVNIDEFDQLSEKQFAFVKHLFQKTSTSIRRMYSETIAQQRRYASFIGTSNHHEILRDPTGNRRYLCVKVTSPIKTETAIDYHQLYAQAKHLILQGERYWLNDEDEALIRKSNELFEVSSPLEQLFLTAFSIPAEGEQGVWMHVTEIMSELQKLKTFNRKTDNSLPNLGRVLTKMTEKGLEKSRDNQGTIYYVKVK